MIVCPYIFLRISHPNLVFPPMSVTTFLSFFLYLSNTHTCTDMCYAFWLSLDILVYMFELILSYCWIWIYIWFVMHFPPFNSRHRTIAPICTWEPVCERMIVKSWKIQMEIVWHELTPGPSEMIFNFNFISFILFFKSWNSWLLIFLWKKMRTWDTIF